MQVETAEGWGGGGGGSAGRGSAAGTNGGHVLDGGTTKRPVVDHPFQPVIKHGSRQYVFLV